MIDLSGKILIEIRDDAGVSAWLGADATRVRVQEAKPATEADEGDVRESGSFVRFIVISPLSTPRDRRVPIQRPTYAINVFGLSPKDAMAGYVEVSDALHRGGVRMVGSGASRAGIWNSWDDSGATPEADPDTGQPFVTLVASFIATDQSVAS